MEFSWGDIAKTDIDQKDIDSIIKKYVDETYPNKVNEYNLLLKEKKEKMISEVNEITFIDNNLMWQDTEVNKSLKLNRLELKVYCRKLNFAQRKDWRVPQFFEMISLVNYSEINPASINKIKYINSSKYWTATPSKHEKKKNWFVDFEDGTTGVDSDLVRYNIRCVRDISTIKGRY